MSESKHTPGPWKAKELGSHGFVDVAADGRPVAFTGTQLNRAEDEANARLIAAAPETTEALEEAIRWIGRLNDWEGAGDPDIDKWRAALNKAKGEQL